MIKAVFLTCLTIAHLLLLADAARAQSIEAARTAQAEGRFFEAAELAETLETSEGYALAAEALAIHSYYIAGDGEKQALFERAFSWRKRRSAPTRPIRRLISRRLTPWAGTGRRSER